MSESRTILGHLRTGLIVTLITVMVWLLAESRVVRTRSLEPQIVLTTVNPEGEAEMVVRQRAGQDPIRTVRVSMTGSLAGLDRFARLLQNRIELRVGRDIPAEPGLHEIDLKHILRESPDLAVHGLIITQVTPPTIWVDVDEVVSKELPVQVDIPEGVELDGVPRSDPASVRVVGPKRAIEQLKAQHVIAKVMPGVIGQLVQGRLETIPGVLIQMPDAEVGGDEDLGDEIQTEPSQVDIRLTLKSQTDRWTIGRLPIQILIAPGEVGKWDVQVSDSDKDLVNVQIEGPASAIELVRSGKVVPQAVVQLSFEDLGRGIESKSAQILGLPSGCRLLNPDFPVKLTISKVESAP